MEKPIFSPDFQHMGVINIFNANNNPIRLSYPVAVNEIMDVDKGK